MGKNELLRGSKSPFEVFACLDYQMKFRLAHPEYFDPDGLLIFCGPQGSGKTLSAVQYCKKILKKYPACKFVTNVDIKGIPETTEVIEYDGLDTLFNVQNGMAGVLYLIDEIHLEFNSLESKNISIEEMTEFAQQRKQRKHIVGTSQVFMRLAKPLREQIKRVILCKNFFRFLQYNQEIDGTTAHEENGELEAVCVGKYFWFHTPKLYSCYDTFAKMHRYKKEWAGRSSAPAPLPYAPDPMSFIVSDKGGK